MSIILGVHKSYLYFQKKERKKKSIPFIPQNVLETIFSFVEDLHGISKISLLNISWNRVAKRLYSCIARQRWMKLYVESFITGMNWLQIDWNKDFGISLSIFDYLYIYLYLFFILNIYLFFILNIYLFFEYLSLSLSLNIYLCLYLNLIFI
jgi:hypothetical protein